ncbi:MAG: response regulator transcription factor [Bacteroidales bacterium]|nr:response regulator transcription factor [Bacteroidales bacterium]
MVRCLIVDDEPPARELIASYISRLNDLVLVEQCGNALEAFSCLQNQTIDLMFLDIQMPKMTGLELIKSLHNPPKIILTTAYKEYASEGFDLDVLDYLVKPIPFERFMRSVAKYHQYTNRTVEEAPLESTYDRAYLFVKVNKEQVKLYFKEIIVIESMKDYIRITTHDASFVTYSRLSYMDEVLPETRFVRIHKSYIIALSEVKSYRNDSVTVGDSTYPVGRIYKKRFQDALLSYQNGVRE